MALFIDIPIDLLSDEGKVVRSESLRQYVQRAVDDGYIGMLTDYFLKRAIQLVHESYELTVTLEYAELKIFAELKDAFGKELAQEVFKKAHRDAEFLRAWKNAADTGNFDLFVQRNFMGFLPLDTNDIEGSIGEVADMLNQDPEEIKRMKGPRIDDSPSSEGTSLN